MSTYSVPCPYCHSAPGEACRTSTDYRELKIGHVARIRLQYPGCPRCPDTLVDGRCPTLGCGGR